VLVFRARVAEAGDKAYGHGVEGMRKTLIIPEILRGGSNRAPVAYGI
jgi:hypothetical protein